MMHKFSLKWKKEQKRIWDVSLFQLEWDSKIILLLNFCPSTGTFFFCILVCISPSNSETDHLSMGFYGRLY